MGVEQISQHVSATTLIKLARLRGTTPLRAVASAKTQLYENLYDKKFIIVILRVHLRVQL